MSPSLVLQCLPRHHFRYLGNTGYKQICQFSLSANTSFVYVLDEIWDLIESVSEGFLTYSYSAETVQDILLPFKTPSTKTAFCRDCQHYSALSKLLAGSKMVQTIWAGSYLLHTVVSAGCKRWWTVWGKPRIMESLGRK